MRQRRHGYILVQALFVIAGLIAFLAMLAAGTHTQLQLEQARLSERRAEQAANAAAARGLAEIQAANANIVTTKDDWAQLGSNGDEEFQLNTSDNQSPGSTPDATFRMQIVDASSQVNLNTASQQQLLLLPLAQEQVDCLLDWIGTGTVARVDGAKDQYYNSLTNPYNTKLGPLTTVDEVLLVKNWTAQTIYQAPTTQSQTSGAAAVPQGWPTDPDGNELPMAALLTVDSGSPNLQASGTARINLNQRGVNVNAIMRLGIPRNLANQIATRAPFASFSALFGVPGMNTAAETQLLNAATFSTGARLTGKLNLNTATQAALETIPTMTSDVAAAIVTQQTNGFQTLGALTTLTALSPQRIQQLADSFTIGSDTWTVRAYGQSGDAQVALEVVVRLTSGQVQIINRTRLNATGVPAWWGWNDQSTTNVDAGSLT